MGQAGPVLLGLGAAMPLTHLAADARQSVTTSVFAVAPTATMAMDSTLAHPRNLAGGAAIIIVGLFALLYLYRRRSYIVYWAAGWACLAGSLFVAGWTYERPQLNWLVYGASQLLSIASALCFVVAAAAYNSTPRFRRAQLPLLAPLATWFLLAPMWLGIEAVLVRAHLQAAGMPTVAGGAQIVNLRNPTLLGAGVVGVRLVLTALTDAGAVTGSQATAGLVAPEAILM